MMRTIEYYNNNAQEFYDRTINLDISAGYKKFLSYLPPKSHILDAGCGVGRDSKYFLSQGYKITAFDASEKMVALASKEISAKVIHATFQDFDFNQAFDGVWAQASLLHIPYEETRKIYERIAQSLKPGGIFYASYKYGDGFMPKKDRDFYLMNEDKVKPYFLNLFEILEVWQEKDNRSRITSQEESWLYFIVRKN